MAGRALAWWARLGKRGSRWSRHGEDGVTGLVEQVEQPAGLIRVLLDESARQDERWDAAGDLESYPTQEAIAALTSVATSAEVAEADETLQDMAAESLAGIWVTLGKMDHNIYNALPLPGRTSAEATLRTRAPHLLAEAAEVRSGINSWRPGAPPSKTPGRPPRAGPASGRRLTTRTPTPAAVTPRP
jgi:hypothetical protein